MRATVSKRVHQSAEFTDVTHHNLRLRFNNHRLIFSVEKVEAFKVLLHVKSNGTLYRCWYHAGTGIGRIKNMETGEWVNKS